MVWERTAVLTNMENNPQAWKELVIGLSRNFAGWRKCHYKRIDLTQLEDVKKDGEDILELGSQNRSWIKLSVTKEVNRVFFVDTGPINGSTGYSATVDGTCMLHLSQNGVVMCCVWEVSYARMFCVLLSCLCSWCVCVGWCGDVLERVASGEDGFDALKFKGLGLIHCGLLWDCLPWWVMTGCLLVTSHHSPAHWSKQEFKK